MSNNKNIIITAALLTASACAFLSCSELDGQHAEPAVGYLMVAGLDVDLSVGEMLPVKSGASSALSDLVPGFEEPSLSQVDFKVTDSKGSVHEWTGALAEVLPLPVGEYTLEASYGSNSFGTPWLTGSYTGNVDALEEVEAAVTLGLKNSLLKVSVTDDAEFRTHFKDPYSLALSVEGQENPYTATLGEYVFAPAGSVVNVMVSGVNSIDNPVTFSTRTSSALVAAHAYSIVCGKNPGQTDGWPVISLPEQQSGAWGGKLFVTPAEVSGNMTDDNKGAIVYEASSDNWTTFRTSVKLSGKYHVIDGLAVGSSYKVRARIGGLMSEEKTVTVAAATASVTSSGHVYSSDVLTGSAVRVAFNVPAEGIIPELLNAGLFSYGASLTRDDSGVEMRTIANKSGQMDHVADPWPYLPKGNYTFYPYIKAGSQEPVALTESAVTIDKPSFDVTLSGYTSYDLYKGNYGYEPSASAANSVTDAETLFGIAAGVTIHKDLLDNGKYAKAFSVTLDGTSLLSKENSGFGANSFNIGDKGGLSWASHTLKASMTFDGETAELSRTHHITGLPYKAEPPTNTGNHPWAGSAYSWNSEYVRLHAHTITQTFHAPADINVTVHHKARVYTRSNVCTYTLSLGGTTLYTLTQSSYVPATKTTNVEESYDENVVLASSNPLLQISNSYGTMDATLEYTNVRVYRLNVDYR